MASRLKNFTLPSFKKGYNSYTLSKSLVDDQEIPYGTNVYLDDNGSATKRSGSSRYGAEVASGKAIRGMGWLKNTSHNKLIVAAGTAWYYNDGSSVTALTGKTFSDDKKTHFAQAVDRLYGANNTDNLCYTTDGSTVTEVTSNGNIGDWPCYFNARLYMTNATYPDRVYFSNPYLYTAGTATFSASNFGSFDTDLGATPVKNAGFIVLFPGGGVEITSLEVDGDYLYATTKRHGVWRIASAGLNDDNSVAHTITQVVTVGGATSGDSVFKNGNDLWYYDGVNYVALGEQAQYQNLRISTKSARVQSEMTSIATSGKDDVVGTVYEEKAYIAYQVGTYNDRVIVYDNRLNAYGTPWEGINVSCFLEFEESDGTRRLLAGSSDSSDSYVYEIETGSTDEGTAISATFETKSTDCGKPGLVKRFAFIDVFYAMVFGTLTYEVFIDESEAVTGSQQLGNSTDLSTGTGALPVGAFPVGADYDESTTFADLAQNDSFRIECGYNSGKKISVRFTNNVSGEQFKINGIVIHYLEGSVHEQ